MENNLTIETLMNDILNWAKDKGIDGPENIERQFLKLVEEVGELSAGLAKNDGAKQEDALGDVFVVWTILVAKLGYDHVDIVKRVYDIISARKGKTVNGVFVKEEDMVK